MSDASRPAWVDDELFPFESRKSAEALSLLGSWAATLDPASLSPSRSRD